MPQGVHDGFPQGDPEKVGLGLIEPAGGADARRGEPEMVHECRRGVTSGSGVQIEAQEPEALTDRPGRIGAPVRHRPFAKTDDEKHSLVPYLDVKNPESHDGEWKAKVRDPCTSSSI